MNNKQIYWTSIEYKLEEQHEKYGKLAGGFVYAFVNCHDVEEALTLFKNKLHQNNLSPFDFEFIKPYEGTEWENKDEQKHFENLKHQALKYSIVVLDDYYMYKKENL